MIEKHPSTSAIPAESEAFRRAASRHLARLHHAARALIDSLPAAPKNAADLTRDLGVLKKSGWQLFRLAKVREPLECVRFVPGNKPLRDMAEIARARGASGEAADELIAAMADFDRFQHETAGDLVSFTSMLGSSGPADAGVDSDRLHRISAFKSFKHFCGMHVDLSQDIDFLYDDGKAQRQHVSVRTVRGLRRLRPDAECVVDSHRTYTTDPAGRILTGPLDGRAFREHGVPVLPQFCSRPLPELVVSYAENDQTQMSIEWAGALLGVAGTVDVCTGLRRDLDVVSIGGEQSRVTFATQVGYPAKRLTRTWLLRVPHKKMQPATLRGYLDPIAFNSEADAKRSPRLYGGLSAALFPSGSWHDLPAKSGIDREQVTYVCATMGWNPSDFAIYFLDLDYPLMHSVIRMELSWT